jgi:hypothetical protein
LQNAFTDCQRITWRLRASQSEDLAMRLVLPVAALALLAVPAYAQTAPPATAPSSTNAVAPPASASAPPTAAPAPAPHPRVAMDQKFTSANTTHDGHLTEDQAKTGYPAMARHFAAIDATKKGYITEDDIRTWEKAERERRHEAQQPATTPPKS